MSRIEESIEVDTTAVELVAPVIAKVLRQENLIGASGDRMWDEFEVGSFIESIVSYAKEGVDPFGYSEGVFTTDNPRITIRIKVDKGQARISAINAEGHPLKPDTIDYEALNLKLQKATGLYQAH